MEVASFERSAPCPAEALGRAAGELGRSGVRRRRARPGTAPPARGGTRRSRPARRASRSPRASRRTARGAPPAPPSAAPRRPCRGSGGDGSERRRPRRSPVIRAGRPPCGRARAAARGRPPAASPGRAPSRRRGGRPGPPPHRARSRAARRRSARRAAPGAAPGSSAARRPCRGPLGRGRPSPRGTADCRPRSPRCALRVSSSSSMSARRPSASRRASASASGSSRIDVAFSLPPPQPGLTSRSSGRATQRRRIGAARDQSTTCSTRSSIGSSAQWRSSITSTSGRSRARSSRSARVASCVSAGEDRIASDGSISSCTSISTSGQYVIPSPYESARPRATVALPSTCSRTSATSLDLPIPAGPISVNRRLLLVATTSSKSERSRARSRSRPTIVRSRRRATPTALASRRCSRCAVTVPAFPFNVSSSGSVVTASRTRRKRVVAEQDLARSGSLLEPGGDVDRVTRDERVALARDDRPRVDPDPRVQPQLLHDVAQLHRRARRPQRVVLGRDGDPEHGHHGVADELLYPAAVPLEHPSCGVVVPVHQRSQRLRIRPLSHRRRPGQVAEQHRHDLPHLPAGYRSEGCAAAGTEDEVVGALASTLCAHRHAPSLRPAQERVNVLRTRQE